MTGTCEVCNVDDVPVETYTVGPPNKREVKLCSLCSSTALGNRAFDGLASLRVGPDAVRGSGVLVDGQAGEGRGGMSEHDPIRQALVRLLGAAKRQRDLGDYSRESMNPRHHDAHRRAAVELRAAMEQAEKALRGE